MRNFLYLFVKYLYAVIYIMKEKLKKTDEEWKEILSPEEYRILRQKGTEPAFSGKYVENKKEGIYICAGCGEELFTSETKYDSGSGWPSFWEPIANEKIEEQEDNSHGMKRTEILCNKCGGHLGHVFEDGPRPSGLRYCVNSASLKFKVENKKLKQEK